MTRRSSQLSGSIGTVCNAGGAPTRGFYGGAGGTISLGLVFGYLAGLEAARQMKVATREHAA